MYSNNVLKNSDAALFNMPSLEEDKRPGDIIQRAEEIQRQAYEEGFASGEKAGFAEGEQKAVLLIDKLEKIIRDILDFQENTAAELEPQVINLSTVIARKIISEEIKMKPEIILNMVQEALITLQRVGTITIKINPALKELISKKKSNLLDIHRNIIFDISSNVSVSGPLVTSETEEVVTDIESLIDNIVKEMEAVGRSKENTAETEPESDIGEKDDVN